jgi:hypothetical protein
MFMTGCDEEKYPGINFPFDIDYTKNIEYILSLFDDGLGRLMEHVMQGDLEAYMHYHRVLNYRRDIELKHHDKECVGWLNPDCCAPVGEAKKRLKIDRKVLRSARRSARNHLSHQGVYRPRIVFVSKA